MKDEPEYFTSTTNNEIINNIDEFENEYSSIKPSNKSSKKKIRY